MASTFFEKRINRKIEISRFRANIYFDNLDPWEELNFINKKITIANCEFFVKSPIPRCSATNLVPNKDEIDINLPLKLKQIYDHINMGIYLSPINNGEIFKNEEINFK